MTLRARLQQRTLYRHLDYRWELFGIGVPHLVFGALPAVFYAAAVAALRPDVIDIHWSSAAMLAIVGGAILDAFAAFALPNWQRRDVLLLGALPGSCLFALALLPTEWRACLPLWPALPAGAFGMTGLCVWQFGREGRALPMALRWWAAPRVLDGHADDARRAVRPFPIDLGQLP